MSIDALKAALADRYTIERELGQGGMATVYLAHDIKHDRDVAIKVLRPDLAAALGAERFLAEVKITARLDHPHILTLIDSGSVQLNPERSDAAPTLFYVMPFVRGESLRTRLTREKQLGVADALTIARQIASALDYAHRQGIIHRDIKPENILLHEGEATLTDFGIALAVNAAGGDRLTGTGLSLGTPSYMSPEQAAGDRDVDARSDIYALGCTLYEMLAGQPPFTGATAEAVVRQHLVVDPALVTNFRPAAPEHVAAALQRALAKAPADRFMRAADFAAALAGGEEHATTRSYGRLRQRAAVVAAVGVVALVAVAAALWMARPRGHALQVGRRSQVTNDPGIDVDPALSPDGKLLAYSGADRALTVREVAGGAPIRVLHQRDQVGRSPAWSHDGSRLIFLSSRGLESVAALGGTSRLIATGADLNRGTAVAPGGTSAAYVSHDSLWVTPIDGGTPHLITVAREMHSPAWSPDGRWIAFVSGNVQYGDPSGLGNVAPSTIDVVNARGGTIDAATDGASINVSPTWVRASELLFVSDRDGSRDIYQVQVARSGPHGPPTRLTTGLNALGITVSADGAHLAYAGFTETSNAWSLAIPTGDTASLAQAQQLTAGDQTLENIDVSHDGHWLAYSSVVGTTSQIYRLRIDQKDAEPQQLTTDTMSSYWASWSPDDKEIAFHRFHGEHRQIFVMPADGGSPVAVTDGSQDERTPEWSPDGARLVTLVNWGTHPALRVYTHDASGRWSAPRPLVVVIHGDTIVPGLTVWSPDGSRLACGCGPGGLVIIPVDGGPAHRLAAGISSAWWAFPQWAADSKTVYQVVQDSTGIAAAAAVPASGAPGHIILRFDDPSRPWHRFGFRVRMNRMYFTLGTQRSDLWVANIGTRAIPP
jgi:serine/threonine-protein kinase